LDGEDVSDILLGTSRVRTKPIFWERRIDIRGHVLHKSPRVAIIDNEWKLLLNPDKSRLELYHIPNDPSELTNLAAAFPALTKRLCKQAMSWYNSLPDAYVHPDAGKCDYAWPGK